MFRSLFVVIMVVPFAVGMGALGVPASAASVATCRTEKILGSNGELIDRIDAFADTIAISLRQRGYKVDYVEDWGGCIRAYIIDPNGGSHMEFFDPDTLEPLTTD